MRNRNLWKKAASIMLLLSVFNPAAIHAKGKTIKTPVIHQMLNVTSNPAGAQVYVNGELALQQTPGVIDLTLQGIITPNKKNMDAAYAAAKKASSVTLTFVKDGYLYEEKKLEPSISKNKVGFIDLYNFDWPKIVNANLTPASGGAYDKDPTIPAGEATNRVSRDRAGQTELERTIIRWFFDSDPQGARIFYRVISSVPAEVKNTNETYLMTTPFEETRSFNIQGLTYENSRDVQIEIKIVKNGYEPQVKRFNVRQAIDQQEISSFFMLVKKEE